MSSDSPFPEPRFPALPDSVRRALGVLLLVAAAVLLGVSALGDAGLLGDTAAESARAWEAFDPELATEARSLTELRQHALAGLSAAEREDELRTVEALYGTVARRFTHGWARHTPATNWILWGLGTLHPGFAHVYDPDTFASRSRSLLCDQAAVVLAELARRSGFPVRLVGLTGHVTVEVWADDDWRYLDPDLEVTGRISDDVFLDLSRLSRRPEAVRALYAGERSAGAPVVLSRQDNFTVPYPERLDWKSTALVRVEWAAGFLKYLVPLALLLAGGRLVRRGPRAVSHGTGDSSGPHGPSSDPARAMARKRGLESRSSS